MREAGLVPSQTVKSSEGGRLHQSGCRYITRARGDQECEFGTLRDGESRPQHQLGGQWIVHASTLPGLVEDGYLKDWSGTCQPLPTGDFNLALGLTWTEG